MMATNIIEIINPSNDAIDSWYRKGLSFNCIQCGICCKRPGPVFVSQSEIKLIALYVGISEQDFRRDYLKEIEGRLSIGDGANKECIMLDIEEKKCKIYEVRPKQCNSFPFWSDILKNQESWVAEGTRCPGFDKGSFYTWEEIQERIYDRR